MKILIADDQAPARWMLARSLEAMGHTVVEADDGAEALDRLATEPVDAIISDLLMPRMDGLRFCTELRRSERWRDLPFLLYSGAYSSARDKALAFARGADAFLSKPAPAEQVLAALEAVQRQPRRHAVPAVDDPEVLREYSERLVSELKAKSEELESTNRELRESRARFEGIINSAMDAIITVDDARRIVLFNGAAEKMFGHPAADVMDQPIERLLPERLQGGYPELIRAFSRSGGTNDLLGPPGKLSGVRRDGTEFPVEASISRIEVAGRNLHTVILRDISERLRAEEITQRASLQLRALAGRLQMAREQERTAVAREIHDVLAQELTRLKIDLVWLGKRLAQPVDETLRANLLKRATEATAQVDVAISTVQRIATALRPVILDTLGLSAAVEWLAEDFTRRTGVQCRMKGPGADFALDRDRATAVFRILQESLTNIVRHAHATSVDISLTEEEDRVVLVVHDDGRGMTAVQIADPRSIGLVGMRERAEAYAGTLEIASQPGTGTTVTLRIPREDSGGPDELASP